MGEHALTVEGLGRLEVTVTQLGEGQPFLLLHGGAGPQSMTGFAQRFAGTKPVSVVAPTHPGFGGTPRPEALASVGGLAKVYIALLEELGLEDVTIVGNSVGGWIAAEMLLLESPRVSGAVLVDAVGIEVLGHPVADFFALTMDEVFKLSFHDPDRFRIDPATLPAAAQEIAAGNRTALMAYAGRSMCDPELTQRLASLEIPTLVLWGESDGVVDPDYGRAYAAAIPASSFQLLPGTGHMPQMETPDQVVQAIWDCADTDFSA